MLLHSDVRNMGFSEKGVAVAGISPRTPQLRPISTKPRSGSTAEDSEECSSTTPTAEEARIPERLPCPPAPKKRKPPLRCQIASGDFFTPPDLETVFIRRPERAK